MGKNIENKEILNNKLSDLRKIFGEFTTSNASIGNLKKYFKDYFNDEIIQIGGQFILDFTVLFNIDNKFKKKFNNEPIQPITITYKRCDVVFFTYDKYPEFDETYLTLDSQWTNWLYPVELKQSVLFAKKEYLKQKNPEEYYLQVNLFDINSNITKYIKDIKIELS